MYTIEDLNKKYYELDEKIKNNEISDELFTEIEAELHELVTKQEEVEIQIKTLVDEANSMCDLHKRIKGYSNTLYEKMKVKKLEEQGIDLTTQENTNKYDNYLLHQCCYGMVFRVYMKRVPR